MNLGMLEQHQLVMPALGRGTELVIRAEPEGRPLGLARWGKPRFWFDGGLIEVCEYDESPLLLLARRTWSLTRCFRVWDAAEVELGMVRPGSLRTPSGREIAWRIVEEGCVTYHLLEGGILANQTRWGEQRLLVFGQTETARNPFLRMLVLAGVLLL